MRGHVYAMISSSLPGLVKIGKTTREPEQRARELSAGTGVPTPFIVGYSIQVSDCDVAETYVHDLLTQRGFRLTDNREFFTATLNDVVRVLIQCENHIGGVLAERDAEADEDPELDARSAEANEQLAAELLEEAERFRDGTDGFPRDHRRAEKALKAALRIGSEQAHYMLGVLYSDPSAELYDVKRAIAAYEEAVKAGNMPIVSLGEIASLYAAAGNPEAATNAYRRLLHLDEVSVAIQFLGRFMERKFGREKENSDVEWSVMNLAAAHIELMAYRNRAMSDVHDALTAGRAHADPEELMAVMYDCRAIDHLSWASFWLATYFRRLGSAEVEIIDSMTLRAILPLVYFQGRQALTDAPAAMLDQFRRGVRHYLSVFPSPCEEIQTLLEMEV